MKRFLSILLAVMLVAAMVPQSLAAEEATFEGYKYVFNRDAYGSESNVSKSQLATKVLSDIVAEKSDPWRPAGQRYVLNALSNENGLYFYSQISRVIDSTTGESKGLANIGVVLEVGAGGTYTPKLTYIAKNSAPIVDVFLVKEGTSVKYNSSEYTTAGITGFATSDGDVTIYRMTSNLSEEYKLGRINMYSDEETELTKTFAPRKLDKNSKYYLLIRAVELDEKHTTEYLNSKNCFTATLKSFELKLDKLDKTHNYVFNNTVLKGDILENTAFTENYRMFYKPEGSNSYTGNYLDSYDNVDGNLSDLWAVSLFGGLFNDTSYKFTSDLSDTRLQMIGRKRLNNGANADANFVLKLNVEYDGIYKVTADVAENTYGTQANVYMIPADETITGINSAMLKNYKSIGRVNNVTGMLDGDIGTVQLTKGDWYIVFAFNSTNTTTASGSRQYFSLKKLTLTETDVLPEDSATPDTAENVAPLSFSATTNIPDIAEVTVNGNEGNLSVLNPARGAGLSVSAPEVPGYKFIGWMAGSANDDGDELANTAKFVNGLEQEDIFTIYTSTFLTAVYEETVPAESEDSVVEFWNLDGSYLGQKSVAELQSLAAEGKTLKTSLIGHTFTGWFTAEDVELNIAEIADKVTHAVAGYTADATLAATNDDSVRVNGETRSDANAYGMEVICTDSGEGTVTHWLRDGKVVSYAPTYKYYVWDSTNITSSYAPIEKKPLVVLDDNTVSGAYMIEYDGAGKTIVEVGILFGTGTPTVGSKSEIFKSQRGTNHGQFAARPTDDDYVARGYMIYEENGDYKVIYSE